MDWKKIYFHEYYQPICEKFFSSLIPENDINILLLHYSYPIIPTHFYHFCSKRNSHIYIYQKESRDDEPYIHFISSYPSNVKISYVLSFHTFSMEQLKNDLDELYPLLLSGGKILFFANIEENNTKLYYKKTLRKTWKNTTDIFSFHTIQTIISKFQTKYEHEKTELHKNSQYLFYGSSKIYYFLLKKLG